MVADRIEIKEGRAGNMAREKLAASVPVGGGHVPRGVDHHHAGVRQMGEEPVRRDEKSETIT